MVDVCCMCGDIGFSDKLFRCNKCRHRIQHSYCSSYYSEHAEPIEICDWCRSETKSSKKPTSSMLLYGRSEYSGGDKIKHRDEITTSSVSAAEKGKHHHHHSSGTPSPRPATRRYKLLKDVMC